MKDASLLVVLNLLVTVKVLLYFDLHHCSHLSIQTIQQTSGEHSVIHFIAVCSDETNY